MPAHRRPSTKRAAAAPPAGKVGAILARMSPEDRVIASARIRNDAWMNVATGMGVIGRDRRMSGQFDIRSSLRSLEEWEELYRGNDAAANIVDGAPDAMTREAWDASIDEDEDSELAEALCAREEELGLVEHINTALKLANALGGSAILLGADDGQKADKPLREDRIRSFNWVTVLTPRELWVHQYYQDTGAPNFAEPELYKVVNVDGDNKDLLGGKGGIIHESRLIRFEGVKVSHRVRRRQRGWGDPVLLRCSEVLRDFNMSWAGAAQIMHDFSQAVMKIKGLAEMIAEDGDESVTKRASAVNISRSLAGLLLIDSEEEFSRETMSVAGYAELLQQWSARLASAARMPISVLMGQAPSGLSGDAVAGNDIRNWYDQIRTRQTRQLKTKLLRVWRLLFLAQDGISGGEEPENYTVCFKPLWQLSETEQAAIRLQQSQADVGYVNAGVLPATVVARSRFGSARYSTETKLTAKDLKTMEDADKLESQTSTITQQAKQKQLQAGATAPGGATEAGGGKQPPGAGAPPRSDPGGGQKVSPYRGDGSEDQPRDETGKWTSGGGGGATPGPALAGFKATGPARTKAEAEARSKAPVGSVVQTKTGGTGKVQGHDANGNVEVDTDDHGVTAHHFKDVKVQENDEHLSIADFSSKHGHFAAGMEAVRRTEQEAKSKFPVGSKIRDSLGKTHEVRGHNGSMLQTVNRGGQGVPDMVHFTKATRIS